MFTKSMWAILTGYTQDIFTVYNGIQKVPELLKVYLLFESNIIPQAQFFHCLRGKGAVKTVKFGRNSYPPILAMKKLGVLLLVSSIEYFDHLLVKNLFFSLS